MMKKILGLCLSIGKAFFSATSSLVWGMAGFFLLSSLIISFNQDASAIKGLLILIEYIMKYWQEFFCILFFYEVITNYGDYFKALKKDDNVKEEKKKVSNGN